MSVKVLDKERVEFATDRKHLEEAFRLVYREYFKKGYCPPSPSEMRISFYHALPQTVTFCLWKKTALAATASIIFDSPMGLPMESVYPDEIKALRNRGRKLCEVSQLALNSQVITKGILPLYLAARLRCLYHIFKPVLWYARKTMGYTDLCIAVNPVHRFLYRSLHFEEFGPERVYESVNKNPSIAMRLDFDHLDEKALKKTPGLHKLFIESNLNLKKITEIFRWNPQDFHYFFAEHSDVLKQAKPEQINYLTEVHPHLSIQKMLEAAPPSAAPSDGAVSLDEPMSGKPLEIIPDSLKATYKDPSGRRQHIKIRNLSRGGVCIENDSCLPKGMSLRLSFQLEGKKIEAQGEVAWQSQSGSVFLHGITFTFMEQKGREWLNTYVMDKAAGQIVEELDFSGLTEAAAQKQIERRSFARFKIPLRIDVGFGGDYTFIQTQIHDISEGGLCLISNFQFNEGQALDLRLWLDEKRFLILKGIIKYCIAKTLESRNLIFNGIEFASLTEKTKQELAQFLAEKRSELGAIEISLDDIISKTDLPEIP